MSETEETSSPIVADQSVSSSRTRPSDLPACSPDELEPDLPTAKTHVLVSPDTQNNNRPGASLCLVSPDKHITLPNAELDEKAEEGSPHEPSSVNPLELLSDVAASQDTLVESESSSVASVSSTAGIPATDVRPTVSSSTQQSAEELARNLMLASEISASRILEKVSRDAAVRQGYAAPSPCALHPDGKTNGVECPKCDVILGSARSLGGHMTMMHSRNSCKTLKCPKCNWHYKYQETLEIHMKEKHPETEVHCVYCATGQPHPRLARGESYTCGYKPYRCDICKYSTTTKGNLSIHMQSDKHLNNVQEVQQGKLLPDPSPLLTKPMPSPVATVCMADALAAAAAAGSSAPAPTAVLPTSAVPSPVTSVARVVSPATTLTITASPQPIRTKPSWRCDVCNYETNVARNLRIHMTSEKHTHNMLTLQQSVKQLTHGMHLASTSQGNELQLQMQLQLAAAAGSASEFGLPLSAEEQAAFYGLQDAAACQTAENIGLYQCCVCTVFMCNLVEDMLAHLQQDRSMPNETDVSVIAGNYLCNLCQYKTHLKANFQLHTKTDKHLQRLQLVNHTREGGPENAWRSRYLTSNNTVQLRCNACNEFANSWQKLQLHASTLRHRLCADAFLQVQGRVLPSDQHYFFCTLCSHASQKKSNMLGHLHSARHAESVAKTLKHLENVQMLGRPGDDLHLLRDWVDVRELVDDDTTVDVERDGGDFEEGKIAQSGSSTLIKFDASSENSPDGNMTDDAVHCCSHCNYAAATESALREHTRTQHGTKDATAMLCPLCQADCGGARSALENHLSQIHSVTPEGIQRLLLCLPSTPVTTAQYLERQYGGQSDNEEDDDNDSQDDIADSASGVSFNGLGSDSQRSPSAGFPCAVCSVPFQTVDELYRHQSEMGHIEMKQTPNGPGYLCWQKGCNQYFKTVPALQMHFREIHAKRPQMAVSDRHVYKFRCSQCSLAFRTEEKLKLHMNYHMIRAATKCAICGRNFRTIDGLKRHVETTHVNLNAPSLLDYKSRLISGGSLNGLNALGDAATDSPDEEGSASPVHNGTSHLDALEDYLNTPGLAEKHYLDPERKFKCHRCKLAFTKQQYLTAHNKTLTHRKGDKVSFNMEKFMDPSRPYKCDTCKESFTQKNILLVHYNSVSHLHKQKKQLLSGDGADAESLKTLPGTKHNGHGSTHATGSASSEYTDQKPYKCNICKNAYSQRSNLDIHMRSVLHQSKAAKLQELVAAGEVDLHQPFIETPETRTGSGNSGKKALESSLTLDANAQQQQHSMATLLALANLAPFMGLPGMPPFLPGLTPTLLTCDHCQTPCFGKEMLDAHQKLCKASTSNHAAASCMKEFGDGAASAPEDALEQSGKYVSSQFLRSNNTTKGTLFRKLLEDYGFEVVMQYNEGAHRKRKREAENEENVSPDEPKQPKIEPPDEDRGQTETSLPVDCPPELSRCACKTCGREFSSIWVLKAHVEHVHGEPLVSSEQLEKLSVEFKEAFEKKQARHNVGHCKTPDKSSKETPEPTDHSRADTVAKSSCESVKQPYLQHAPAVSSCSVSSASMSTTRDVMNPAAAALAATMGLGMPFPFMGMPFGPFGFPSPFLPMMPMPGLDQLSLASVSAALSAASATCDTSPTKVHTSVSNAPMNSLPASVSASFASPIATIQQPKRARTRITDDQLKVLREYFDINNSPTEEMVEDMARKSGLPQKVIKHWFRNTLFKERQRNKDSPYNFSVPPQMSIDLEQYEKTGEAKIIQLNPEGQSTMILEVPKKMSDQKPDDVAVTSVSHLQAIAEEIETTVAPTPPQDERTKTPVMMPKIKMEGSIDRKRSLSLEKEVKIASGTRIATASGSSSSNHISAAVAAQNAAAAASLAALSNETMKRLSNLQQFQAIHQSPASIAQSTYSMLTSQSSFPNTSQTSPASSTSSNNENITALITNAISPSGSLASPGRRANRTRFTDDQIKVLQDFFDKNAYPKDDDLEMLSKRLGLSPRVIVVWFQNARQKARKMYENQPADGADDRIVRTPGQNYQCKKCHLVFQRYYELIKHQQNVCYKDDEAKIGSLKSHKRERAISAASGGGTITPKFEEPDSMADLMCHQCDIAFSGSEQLQEHLKVHASNPALIFASQESTKRSLMDLMQSDAEPTAAKRQRQQIEPEQLDVLLQKYSADTNPTGKNLEQISQETGLNKRVVQVWFQNTRARERKGQSVNAPFNKRCPFCGILFHTKPTMEAHLHTRHREHIAKTDVQIDALPNAEEVPTITAVTVAAGGSKSAQESSNELAQSLLSFGMIQDTDGGDVLRSQGAKVNPELINWLCKASNYEGKTHENPLDLSHHESPDGHGRSPMGPLAIVEEFNSTNSYSESRDGMSPRSDIIAHEMDSEDAISNMSRDTPSPHRGGTMYRPQKRFRTHLSSLQIKVMKTLFQDYKTPSMAECELLGNEIGLHKRVVQVWFQNARAKERKWKSGGSSNASTEPAEQLRPGPATCSLCKVTYGQKCTVQDHVFTKAHVRRVKDFIGSTETSHESHAGSSHVVDTHAIATAAVSASPAKTKQHAAKEPVTQPAESADLAANLLPYMCASSAIPAAYYASLMYPGAFSGLPSSAATMFYDPSVHGTPVNMLQIPLSVMQDIQEALGDSREHSIRFTQDGFALSDLTNTLSRRDAEVTVEADQEVGWACRQCQTVFPQEALFKNHQNLVCHSAQPAFVLVQTHYECSACRQKCGTQAEFKTHIASSSHSRRIDAL